MLYKPLKTVISSLNLEDISKNRKQILQPLIDYIQCKVDNKQLINLNFICTHNSRRSHLSQIWAQTIAQYYQIKNIFCYSGGTEVTQVYPMIIEILRNTGFLITTISENKNSIYNIKYGKKLPPIIAFSKKHNDDFNPQSNFAAILTCSQADENCPFIVGAKKRISIMYKDPKQYDYTPQQKKMYHKRSLQIATELSYVFSQIT